MQHRTRPVDEQHPQVGIALLADRAEVPALSRGMFARREAEVAGEVPPGGEPLDIAHRGDEGDRKSTRLNSSHSQISYAVFCLKKKKKQQSMPVHSGCSLQAQTRS